MSNIQTRPFVNLNGLVYSHNTDRKDFILCIQSANFVHKIYLLVRMPPRITAGETSQVTGMWHCSSKQADIGHLLRLHQEGMCAIVSELVLTVLFYVERHRMKQQQHWCQPSK